jgi:hypothetical protein
VSTVVIGLTEITHTNLEADLKLVNFLTSSNPFQQWLRAKHVALFTKDIMPTQFRYALLGITAAAGIASYFLGTLHTFAASMIGSFLSHYNWKWGAYPWLATTSTRAAASTGISWYLHQQALKLDPAVHRPKKVHITLYAQEVPRRVEEWYKPYEWTNKDLIKVAVTALVGMTLGHIFARKPTLTEEVIENLEPHVVNAL